VIFVPVFVWKQEFITFFGKEKKINPQINCFMSLEIRRDITSHNIIWVFGGGGRGGERINIF